MQVFKIYFKLLNHYKGVIILYSAIFIAVALIMTGNLSSNDSKKGFEEAKLDIAIIDQDEKTLGVALKEYFGKNHNLVEMEYDEDAILNELYWRKLDYVLVIPKGFEDSLLKEGQESMEFKSMKVPGMFDASYFESELSLYTSKLTGLLAAGYSIDEAENELLDLQEQKTKVTMASFVNKKQNDACTVFFTYAPYLFITLGMNGIGIILLRFNEKEVKDRMECSSTSMKARIGGITGGILVFGVMMLAAVVIIAGILSKGSIYTDMRFPFFLFNLFSMLVLGLSLGFLTGTIARNSDEINGMVNIISLALCFLGGVFVPQQFFSNTITRVARFFPTYWYVATNETIGGMKKLNTALLEEIFSQIGLVFCYALVLFAVTLVVISNKRKRAA